MQALPGTLQDLSAPQYKGKVRVSVGVDKGGNVVRWGLEVASYGLHLIGAHISYDDKACLDSFLAAQQSWPEEFENILLNGIEMKNESGELVNKKIQLCIIGDKMAISDLLGIQGSSCKFPIVWDLTPSHHLRKFHLDGSPHVPGNENCDFPRRDIRSLKSDFFENLR